MFIPAQITLRNRKVEKGVGIFSGVFCNAPNGQYEVLGVVDTALDGFDPLLLFSKGRLFSRILSIRAGLLAVIEPLEVMIHEERA